jgi:hypothetical protein
MFKILEEHMPNLNEEVKGMFESFKDTCLSNAKQEPKEEEVALKWAATTKAINKSKDDDEEALKLESWYRFD